MNNSNLTSEEYRRYSASIRIKNAPNLHDDISKRLTPSHVHRKGDQRYKENTWDNDIWIMKSPLPDETELVEHILWIWEQVKPHVSYFARLKNSGVDIDLFCKFTTDSDQDGFSIDSRVYEFLYQLQIDIECSIITLFVD